MDSEQKELGFLDIINIVSFLAQMKNINDDEHQTNYINDVIHALFEEIQKLHKENDLIFQKLDLLLKKLEEKKEEVNEL